MKRLPCLLIVALCIYACGIPLSANGQSYTDSIAVAKTLLSGTTYYYPDGSAANDSGWIKNGESVPWRTLTLFVRQDTVVASSGYPRPTDFPCSLRIELIAGVRTDTFSYLGYSETKFYYNDLDSSQVAQVDSMGNIYNTVRSQLNHDNGYVIFNDALSRALPIDTCYFIPIPDIARFNRYRFKVTVTDTMKAWLTVVARK